MASRKMGKLGHHRSNLINLIDNIHIYSSYIVMMKVFHKNIHVHIDITS